MKIWPNFECPKAPSYNLVSFWKEGFHIKVSKVYYYKWVYFCQKEIIHVFVINSLI
jgi:hypothetical protein